VVETKNSDRNLTRQLADQACAVTAQSVPDDVRIIATHSILDLIGLSISSSDLPLVEVLRAEATELQGRAESSAIGSETRVPAFWAASINAAAGHVLAYDDCNMVIPGHTTAVVWPAAFALAEASGSDGQAVLEAYVAASETMCRIGEMLQPSHYDSGFHASGTVGAFGAAAAAGRIMGLDPEKMAQALSLSASMASGLKGSFGTMLKPFQVARAAGNGILAASLANRGLSGRGDLLEAIQGFAATHSRETLPARAPDHAVGHYIRSTLYKYHAACYLTHGPMEAAAHLRAEKAIAPENIEAVTVVVNPMAGKVCNIQRPTTGPELGYSLKTLTAMAISGIGVTRAADLTISHLDNPSLVSLADKVAVTFDENLSETACRLEVVSSRGRFETSLDLGVPETNLDKQGQRVVEKFRSLAVPVIGEGKAEELIGLVSRFYELPSMEPIAALIRRL
jgi:2-methylcitrate dehydratase PrpD